MHPAFAKSMPPSPPDTPRRCSGPASCGPDETMVPLGDNPATAKVTWCTGVSAPHVRKEVSRRQEMSSISAATRAAVLVAGGMILLVATSTAGAQNRRDHGGKTAASTRPRTQPPVAGPIGVADTRRPVDHARNRSGNGSTVFYVPAGGYGYGYGYGPGFYDSHYVGSVSDANGRPLWSTYENLQPAPSAGGYGASSPSGGGYGYTPDLSGSPYVVSDEGMMVVDFSSGERRAFPSCAQSADQRDPQGRPRTIFYRSPDYWMVLRPGQQGRVRGEPAAGKAACYAIDSVGRVVLRY